MLFYFFILTLNIIFIKNEKLIFAEIISRHGARGPVRMDDDGVDLLGIKWNNKGELTPIGQRMEYLLGVYNRHRYITGKDKLLSEKFDPHELVIYSSDINRTLSSITSQLQGLYPVSKENGDKITPEQFNMSFPPVNKNFKDIEKELALLNDSALPNYITVIPIHFITLKNATNECVEKIKEINNNNAKTKPMLSNLLDEFNKNYSEKLNRYYNKTNENKYDFSLINHIYDTILVDMIEGKNISDFFEINKIDMNTFIEKTFEVLSMNFKDYIFGDDKNEVMIFYNTMLFRKMIDNMKRKIEDDIKGNPSVKNVSDFSRPKMVIISGHDTTLSAHQLLFIKYFGLKIEQYEFPAYASQISYEITRFDDDNDISDKNLTFSDYNFIYYFNNKPFLNITFDKFIDKIEKVLWTDEEMTKFCFGDKKVLKVEEEEDQNESNMILIIIMGIVILILVITIIFLVIKLTQKSEDEFGDNEKDDSKLLKDN